MDPHCSRKATASVRKPKPICAVPEESEDSDLYNSDSDPEYLPDKSGRSRDISSSSSIKSSDDNESNVPTTSQDKSHPTYRWYDVSGPGTEKCSPPWTE